MSDTLLHCFACEAFSPQSGEELQCSVCASDFVEIVQVERSPGNPTNSSPQPAGASNTQSSNTPGLPGMLSNLLSSILPEGLMNPGEQPTPEQGSEQARSEQHPAPGHVEEPELPPFNDFFSQMFGQFPQGRTTTSGNTSYTRTTHGPGGSSFVFSFGSSAGGQPTFYTSQTTGNEQSDHPAPPQMPFPFGNVHDGIPQIHTGLDLASFLSQALGAIPGRAGDYVHNEALFDNIISELMNRNPQANVHAASDAAIAQIHRFKVQKGAPGLEGSKIGEECSICQDEYKEDETLVDLRCHHVYHEECLLSWVKTNGVCPICRAPVTEVEEVPEQDTLD